MRAPAAPALGATVIFRDHQERFLATVPETAGAAAVTAILVAAAVALAFLLALALHRHRR